jgi:DNA helicase-2/ATP-dependent DNA helicase PcrA
VPDEEEALCRRVVEHLKAFRPSRPPPRSMSEEDVMLALRDEIAVARLEDVPALMQQMEQVQALISRKGTQSSTPVDPKSPYFGHLRLREKQRGTRDVLIGKGTHIDTRTGIRIVDWRHAPVSQLYYRHEEGARYEESFGGREVEGVIEARRTVSIEDGRLTRVASPQGVFVRRGDGWKRFEPRASSLRGGEGSAVRADHMRGVLGDVGAEASQREDRHLPEIAALLDARQFEVISRPDAGLVVVVGGAGSGKTTIGVHRMAYLAYRARGRFAPDRMLVVVGTPALEAYIGHLLDALGLGDVQVDTFARWARRQREASYPWLTVPVEEYTPAEVARLKTDPALLGMLEARGRALRAEGRRSQYDALWLWAEVLTNADALRRAFDKSRRLTPAQLERAIRHCAERCPSVLEYGAEDAEPEETEPIEGIDGHVEPADERSLLDPEDEALLLRAYQVVVGPLIVDKHALRYEHLFVDEAQDLAPVDLVVLAGVVTTQKSITLAGDLAQRIHVETGFDDWSEVLDALALEHVAVEPLRIAYRSTRQVMELAREVLGALAPAEEPLAPREGAPVDYHPFPTTGAAAAFLAEALRPLFVREPRATVAVLARYAEQADAYYEALRKGEVPNLNRVRSYDFSFRPGIDVTDIRQVKGLEYDYVVLVDVTASTYPETDESRYLLHIGATRAAHQLWVMSAGPPSPLLPRRLLDEA